MKKVMTALIFVCALFAIIVNVTGADPDNTFSFRSYFEYVTTHIEPFPTINFDGSILEDVWGIITYIFPLIECIVHNVSVVLYGFFPITWTSDGTGVSGGGGLFGDFGGGGFGGGGGGGR